MPIEKMTEVPYPGVVPWLAVRKKINEIIENGAEITVDDALSRESENPVQNKVITLALANKAEIQVWDTAPTSTSVGVVGDFWLDTTTSKLYLCTDDTNPYVWEEVGGESESAHTLDIYYNTSSSQYEKYVLDGVEYLAADYSDLFTAIGALSPDEDTQPIVIVSVYKEYQGQYTRSISAFNIWRSNDTQNWEPVLCVSFYGEMGDFSGYSGTGYLFVQFSSYGMSFSNVNLATKSEVPAHTAMMIFGGNTYNANDTIAAIDLPSANSYGERNCVGIIGKQIGQMLIDQEVSLTLTGNTLTLKALATVTPNWDYGIGVMCLSEAPWSNFASSLVLFNAVDGSITYY